MQGELALTQRFCKFSHEIDPKFKSAFEEYAGYKAIQTGTHFTFEQTALSAYRLLHTSQEQR